MAKRIPAGCEGFFDQNYGIMGPKDYLSILSKGLKYILPRDLWDYSGPINYRYFFDHPNIQHMEDVFCNFNSSKMEAKTIENQCLKWLVRYEKGLKRKHCKRRIRKKRVTRLWKWSRSQIRLIATNRDKTKGIVLFALTVKNQFLSKS
ncbi:MAG: hypothetical protein JRJ77_13255 [Deltaproteobacteria bacterium]|nr:hypothetical protein [Deltaproteobacteria bacterium]